MLYTCFNGSFVGGLRAHGLYMAKGDREWNLSLFETLWVLVGLSEINLV